MGSLQAHAPGYARFAMVVDTMSAANRRLLVRAGWHLIRVSHMPPNSDSYYAKEHWWDEHTKVNILRLRLSKILYLDADTVVLSSQIRSVLNLPFKAPGHLWMVKDCCNPHWNGGVMLFRPSLAAFHAVVQLMRQKLGWKALNQPAINEVFDGKIDTLDSKFNAHGLTPSCANVVIAHFTGPPNTPDAQNECLLGEPPAA